MINILVPVAIIRDEAGGGKNATLRRALESKAVQLVLSGSAISKERVPISDDLAAAVMFASDRTCCVCRLEKKVQIHHVDGDPANNALDNLAIICLNCHSDAHTNGAFVRNLTPELIRLYNSSWREIVRLKLHPRRDDADKAELAAEAFLEATLDAHSWMNHFRSLAGALPDGRPRKFADGWDQMEALWIPAYSQEAYSRFRPLFTNGLSHVQSRFDRLIQLFPDVLPPDFRALLVRASRHLAACQSVYAFLPALRLLSPDPDGRGFYHGFAQVIGVLREVCRAADSRRETLTHAASNRAREATESSGAAATPPAT